MLHIEWVEVWKQKTTGWLSTTHEMPTGAKKTTSLIGYNPGIWQWQHNRITRTSKLLWKGWMKDKAIKVMQHESTWCNTLPSQLLRFLHISRYHHVRLLVMPGFSHFSHKANGSKNKKLLKLIQKNCWKVWPLAQCFINLRLSGPQPTLGKWRKDFQAKCSQPRQVEAVSASMTSGM